MSINITNDETENRVEYILWMLNDVAKKVEEILPKLAENPSSVMEWHGTVLANAEFARRLKNGIENLRKNGSKPEGILASVSKECLRIVFYGSSLSTNAISNANAMAHRDFAIRLLECAGITADKIGEAFFPTMKSAG